MTERWDRRIDRKLAPGKVYISIVPGWFRVLVLLAAASATTYLAIEDRQPFRALWLAFSSYQLGFLITLLVFLVPCLAVIYALAWHLHRRRKKRDFPTATVHRG